MENADLIVKIIGWTLLVGPVIVFMVLSGYMVWGAAKDDEVIMGIVMAGFASVGIGLVVLIFMYFTDFSLATAFGA